jgi:hypothetical protein
MVDVLNDGGYVEVVEDVVYRKIVVIEAGKFLIVHTFD